MLNKLSENPKTSIDDEFLKKHLDEQKRNDYYSLYRKRGMLLNFLYCRNVFEDIKT